MTVMEKDWIGWIVKVEILVVTVENMGTVMVTVMVMAMVAATAILSVMDI